MDYFTDKTEIKKRKELVQLMDDWKAIIRTKPQITFSDNNKPYDAIEYFNSDGFFPGYFKASKRILFIGRESRYNSPCYSNGDRITTELDRFNKGINPNTSSYWRRLLYIVYGIQNNAPSFDTIPEAKAILSEMVKKQNYGFAIMNISKYSNDSEYGATADFALINRFLSDSNNENKNFIKEEISLLEPDIIITANLWDGNINFSQLEKVFPEENCKILKVKKGIASMWDYNLDNKKNIKLIDTWHFSRRGNDQQLFYDPIMDFLFEKNK